MKRRLLLRRLSQAGGLLRRCRDFAGRRSIALVSLLITLTYAGCVMSPGRDALMAITARTETAIVTTEAGPENTWPIEGFLLCVPDDEAMFSARLNEAENESVCPRGNRLLERRKGYDTLRIAAGVELGIQRSGSGRLVIVLQPVHATVGNVGDSVGQLRALARPELAPRPLGPVLYLLETGPPVRESFTFVGDLVVGAAPRPGNDRLLLSGRIQAFHRSWVTGERYPVAATELDVGDIVVLDDGQRAAPTRGFFRIAPDGQEGLVLNAQVQADGARIVRFGELDGDDGFGYVFSPSWTARLLADPFGLALAALVYLAAALMSILTFLTPSAGGQRDGDGTGC